jgi:hypothetical protein
MRMLQLDGLGIRARVARHNRQHEVRAGSK